jgi:3-isopropylmalate/(R)-2-methylmalate dehydratase small subunit
VTPFVRLQGVAAALPVANIDTDTLFPARFLKTTSRRGLGRMLLHDQRFASDGRERPQFVLNQSPWREAKVLVTLDNLGSGSSREHAVWALSDFGIRCVVAPSFADIFRMNCLKNGVLPIAPTPPELRVLLADAADPGTCSLDVNLERQEIRRANGAVIPFRIEAESRRRLLGGIDDVAATLGAAAEIERFEAVAARERPWITAIPALSPAAVQP